MIAARVERHEVIRLIQNQFHFVAIYYHNYILIVPPRLAPVWVIAHEEHVVKWECVSYAPISTNIKARTLCL